MDPNPANCQLSRTMGNFLKTEMSQECVSSESRIIQFRSEFYNMFNHTQFSAVDSTARFDAAGSQVNTRLGQVTGTRSARVIQFALSFKF